MEQRTVFSTARNVDHARQPDAAQTLKQIGLCRREASERVSRDRLAVLQAACQGTGSDWTDIPSGVPAMHGAGLTFSLSRRAASGRDAIWANLQCGACGACQHDRPFLRCSGAPRPKTRHSSLRRVAVNQDLGRTQLVRCPVMPCVYLQDSDKPRSGIGKCVVIR